jgi:hypothetical protein
MMFVFFCIHIIITAVTGGGLTSSEELRREEGSIATTERRVRSDH